MDSSDYRLSDLERVRLADDLVKEELADKRSVSLSSKPKAIIIAGQPGAGKSEVTDRAERQLMSEGYSVKDYIVIDIDEYRKNHPKYQNLREENPRQAASLVQSEASYFGERLKEAAIEKRTNLIIDGTLSNPDKAEQMVRDLKTRGYEIEIHAVAVDSETSTQRVELRYQSGLDRGKPRYVPEFVSTEAYKNIPESLERCSDSGCVDRVKIYEQVALQRDQQTGNIRWETTQVSEFTTSKPGNGQRVKEDYVSARDKPYSHNKKNAYKQNHQALKDVYTERPDKHLGKQVKRGEKIIIIWDMEEKTNKTSNLRASRNKKEKATKALY